MMVTTKYRGPTDTKGSAFRVIVFDYDKTTKVIPYDYSAFDASESAVVKATGKTPRYIGTFENGTKVWEI
jgi:hypothetical protein